MADIDVQNRKSRMEKAEGDRETAISNARRGQPDSARGDEDAGGITNRPLDEEIENQGSVPDRGHRKSEDQNR